MSVQIPLPYDTWMVAFPGTVTVGLSGSPALHEFSSSGAFENAGIMAIEEKYAGEEELLHI
jgi:hypothetical protein